MGQMQRAYFEGLGFSRPEYINDIGCRGKVSFDSHDDATRCIKRIGKRGKDHGRLLGQNIYRCHRCGKWHIGQAMR